MAEDGGMPRERWSGPELLSQLQRFEAALRVAGLRETTVQTLWGAFIAIVGVTSEFFASP
jgi:hypothetical protein